MPIPACAPEVMPECTGAAVGVVVGKAITVKSDVLEVGGDVKDPDIRRLEP